MTESPLPTRIGLVHAVYPAMAPIASAFRRCWPEAHTVNLIDDALPADLERDGHLTEAMHGRIFRLAEHAIAAGADGVLFTCSAFGEAIARAAARLPQPILRPDEAMFEAALSAGPCIGLLATFEPAIASMQRDFNAQAARHGLNPKLDVICIPEAIVAARAGDLESHNRLVTEAAPRLAHCDAVMLAHFSTSSALADVQAVMPCAVLSAPEAAVQAMRQRLTMVADISNINQPKIVGQSRLEP